MGVRFLFLLSFCFLFLGLKGQERTYNFLHFTEKDGLLDNQVAGLAQDHQGLIWISSKKGLSFFDGFRFVDINFNQDMGVLSNYLGKIAIDAKDRIWITTTNRGLLCYDRSKTLQNSVTAYFAKVANGDLIKSELYDVLASKSGLIYFGGQETDLQVLNPETGQINSITLPGTNPDHYLSIYVLKEDHKGNIWIGTRYNGLICYNPKTKTAKQIDLKNPGENGVSGFALTEKTVFSGYYDYDILSFDYEMNQVKGKLMNWGKNKDYYDNFASAMAYWPEERQLLIGHNSRGMETYRLADGHIERISWSEMMPEFTRPSRISDILPVKDGYWIASEQGLFYYAKPLNSVSSLYRFVNEQDNPIISLMDWGDEIWYRTKTHFGQLSLDYKTRISSFSFDGKKVSAASISENVLYFSTYDQGVFEFSRQDRKFKPLSIIGNLHRFYQADCNTVMEDTIAGESVLWIGSWSSGLYRYHLKSQTMELFDTQSGLPNHKVIAIGKDPNGQIWLGMDGFGLIKILNKENPVFKQFKHNNKQENSLESNTIFSFYTAKDGRFWFTNQQSGVGEIVKKGQDYQFIQYADGNPYPWLYATRMMQDSHQLMWIKALDGTLIFDQTRNLFYHLIPGKGIYPPSHIETYNYYLRGNDLIWCTGKGLIRGNLNELPFRNQHMNLKPIISKFSVLHQEETYRMLAKNLVLAANENNIAFSFSVPEQALESPLKFAYRLEGLEEEWVMATPEQTANYNNLKGGTYTFKLKVGDRFGNWSPQEVEIPIYLKSYWYATWWFKTLVILSVAATVIFFFVYRINQQKKINKLQVDYNIKLEEELAQKVKTIREQEIDIEREKQARIEKDFKQRLYESELKAIRSQMNPHFIFNVLNSIEAYVVENDSTNASSLIQKFASLSRIVLENSQFSVVSIKSEMQLVRLYLELEQSRFNYGFDFEIKSNGNQELEYVKIPSMLIQPLVENAVHHGIRNLKDKKGKILIRIEVREDLVYIWILDNGVGFKKPSPQKSNSFKSTSFGIKGIQERIQMINNNFEEPLAHLYFDEPVIEPGFITQISIVLPKHTEAI